MRVTGVFTGTTISPSPWSRQCPNRYTIRAGRNLPDKEFRSIAPILFPVRSDFILMRLDSFVQQFGVFLQRLLLLDEPPLPFLEGLSEIFENLLVS